MATRPQAIQPSWIGNIAPGPEKRCCTLFVAGNSMTAWGSNPRLLGLAPGAAPATARQTCLRHTVRRPNQRCSAFVQYPATNIADRCDARTPAHSEGQLTPVRRPVGHAVLATPRGVQPNEFPGYALQGHGWQRRGSSPRPCDARKRAVKPLSQVAAATPCEVLESDPGRCAQQTHV